MHSIINHAFAVLKLGALIEENLLKIKRLNDVTAIYKGNLPINYEDLCGFQTFYLNLYHFDQIPKNLSHFLLAQGQTSFPCFKRKYFIFSRLYCMGEYGSSHVSHLMDLNVYIRINNALL